MIIGAITLGTAPRDDVVPMLERRLGPGLSFVQAGALDGAGPDLIESMVAAPGERAHVTRLADGSSTPMLSHAAWAPLMQTAMDTVVAQGAELVVILCASDWSELKSDVIALNAGPLCDGIAYQLAAGRRLGVIRPRPDSPGEERARGEVFARADIEPITRVLNPYDPATTPEQFADLAREFRELDAELVYLACMGMGDEMRAAAERAAGVPVISAQGVIAAALGEATHFDRLASLGH